jgi:predicted nucleic acid-binding protein
MIVVADTTPLNYLALIGQIELLAALYRSVLIPREVHRELQRPKAPAPVRAWAANLPPWCEVRTVSSAPDPALSELDPGEREAIQLALEVGVAVLT